MANSVVRMYLQRRSIHFSRMPQAVLETTVKICGSVFDDNGKPLNPFKAGSEEDLLVMKYLGVDPKEQGARAAIESFWRDMFIKVPYGNKATDGYVLDLTKDEDGNYVNQLHYFQYEWLKRHKHVFPQSAVASGELDGLPEQLDLFILVDPQEAAKSEQARIELLDEAFRLYQEASSDDKVVKMLLEMMYTKHNQSIDLMNEVTRRTLLRDLATDKEYVEEFLKIASDKTLRTKYFVKLLVDTGTLQVAGNAYYDNGKKLADDLNELVVYLDSESNQGERQKLKDRMIRNRRVVG